LRTGLEVFGAMSGQIARAIKSVDRKKVLAEQIKEFRSKDYLFFKMAERFKSAYTADFAEIENMERATLYERLRRDRDAISRQMTKGVGFLETLGNLILAYHSAHKLQGVDFTTLLNQIKGFLPRGTVGDHGQLTSISTAIAAYAT